MAESGTQDYDLLIVGGGMIGSSLAIALSGRGLRIVVVECREARVEDLPGYDDRAIALSEGSRRIFAGLGVWAEIAAEAEPITRIHVSERGGFGFTHIDAAEESVPALGHVAPARHIGGVLLGRLRRLADVQLLAPARVIDVQRDSRRVGLRIDVGGVSRWLQGSLLVAADGGDSSIRQALGMQTRILDYRQFAVTANIGSQQPHQGRAFERFTEEGPLALLPMTGQRSSLVWTLPEERYPQVMEWDEQRFLEEFQQRFGWRLGRLHRVGKRSGYPLRQIRASRFVDSRVVLLGNAAHTLHPIAGQGLNLGMRDVAALAGILEAARSDPGADAVLQRYQRLRQRDQREVSLATDVLARLFVNPLPPLRLARNLGLLAVDMLPGARHLLARSAMGLRRHQMAAGGGWDLG